MNKNNPYDATLLILDRSLPEKLELLPIEREVFFLIHYSCWKSGWNWHWSSSKSGDCDSIRRNLPRISKKSVTEGKTREEAAEDEKDWICDQQYIDCSTLLNNTSWMNCSIEKEESGPYKWLNRWCSECPSLSNCLGQSGSQIRNDKKVIELMLEIFFGWRPFVNKRLIIKAMSYHLLQLKNYDQGLFELYPFMVSYINNIKPYPNINLTLLDAWSYSFGKDIFTNHKPDFYFSLDKTPIETLNNCTLDGDEENCNLARSFSKEIMKKQDIWGNIYKEAFQDFIPLCSFGTDDYKLRKCTEFKQSMTRINQRPCFTFNETTLVPRLGPTEGVNFLINFDYLATDAELKQPISITVHEPEAHPDIENFERKNFIVFPGTHQFLRLGSTVLDSTRTFDEISLDRRTMFEISPKRSESPLL